MGFWLARMSFRRTLSAPSLSSILLKRVFSFENVLICCWSSADRVRFGLLDKRAIPQVTSTASSLSSSANYNVHLANL